MCHYHLTEVDIVNAALHRAALRKGAIEMPMGTSGVLIGKGSVTKLAYRIRVALGNDHERLPITIQRFTVGEGFAR